MSDEKEIKVRLFAFWRYDTFPFILGSEMTTRDEDGNVYVPAYSSKLTPCAILPYEEGAKINNKLKELTSDYRKSLDVVHKAFMEKRDEIIKI